MAEGLSGKWENFRPSKALWLWTAAGCIVATVIVGFTFGGWVMGGTANEMAATAREEGRASLAAQLCVNNFVSAPNASSLLADLKEADSWERDTFIEDGGWANLTGSVEIVDGSLDLCAERLAAMDELPVADGQDVVETGDTSDT